MGALTSASTSVVADSAAVAVQALLGVAGRFPLAGPIAGVLQDLFALYKVWSRPCCTASVSV